MRNIAIASDHAGYYLKQRIVTYLQHAGYRVHDLGTDSGQPFDYPDVIRPAALSVACGQDDMGIVLGGSGNGEAMVANKIHGIRCALCWNLRSAALAKQHNNANMISLGARMVSEKKAVRIVERWLHAEFQGGRHKRRIDKIETQGS